jgi:hypothetical protein
MDRCARGSDISVAILDYVHGDGSHDPGAVAIHWKTLPRGLGEPSMPSTLLFDELPTG